MGRSGGYWPRIRSQLKRLFVWIVVAVIVVIAIGLVYFTLPFEGATASIDAVEDDERVTIDWTDPGYVLQPAEQTPEAAVIFYPGARVHPTHTSAHSLRSPGSRTQRS